MEDAFGFSFGVFGGAGTPSNQEFLFRVIPQEGTRKIVAESDFLPIKVGFDVNFLWDFLEKGNHTLGLTLGAIPLFLLSFFEN